MDVRRRVSSGMVVLALSAGSPTAAMGWRFDPPSPPAPGDQPPIEPAETPAKDQQPAAPGAAAPKQPEPKAEPKAEPKTEPKKTEPVTNPQAPDSTKSRAVDDVAKEQDAARGDPGPIAPKRNNPPVSGRPRPVRPGLPSPKIGVDDVGVPTGGRFGDGKFLLRRTGTLLKAPTGEWIFVFAKTTARKPERPAVLLPCAALTRLEAQIGAANQESSDTVVKYPESLVTITGEVFSYVNREYILLSVFSVAQNTPEPEAPAPAPEEPAPAAGPDAAATTSSAVSSADPAVDDLIKDLQTRRGNVERRAISPGVSTPSKTGTRGETSAAAPVVAAPLPQGLQAEGTLLASKRGRLVRLRGGELAFGIDNDVATAALPLVILPCKTLERLENLYYGRNDATVVEMSGRVTVYRGQNYLLPTSFVVPAPSDVRPAQ